MDFPMNLIFSPLRFGLVLSALAASASAQSPAAPQHSLTYLLEGNAFASIPAGEFTMGSRDANADEAPPHRVRISKGFEMGKFEVTQAQWRAVMDSPHGHTEPSEKNDKVDPSHFKGAALPVENVSWDSVQTFIRLLNTRDERHTYRLPTEAEWEYAARAGQTGDTPANLENAWCESTAGGKTLPVAQKAANAWGLHDMLGNVMEWVQDWYAPDYYTGSPRVDPRGPGTGSYKVYRGGAWLSNARQCRVGFRGFDFPSGGYYSVGFRLVRTRK
jgi:formylglycine-generating enzyme required for sulfatase activity